MPHTLDEAMLLKALQQRMLDEIARKQDGITNNVSYGGGAQAPLSGGAGGIAAAMSGGGSPVSPSEEDLLDYFVSINRKDEFDPNDPKKRIGWNKEVHRYSAPKDEKPTKKAKRGK